MRIRFNPFAVVAIIAVVNALGYGIIIPVLYSYAKQFGLSDFENGLLFSIFSVCQFLATPAIGRLSDKYGRKPLLVLSLLGTVASFVMMALAKNPLWLFAARALDGITAGNISVASAVISDTTDVTNRSRGFGVIGAAFGFGFVFGPAISAATLGWGIATPFWIAAGCAALAVVVTQLFLPETNTHRQDVAREPLFPFAKIMAALVDIRVGTTLVISLLYAFALSMFIFAYQPFSVHILHLSAAQISVNFTIFGVVSLFSQAFLIHRAAKAFGDRRVLVAAFVLATATFASLFFVRSLAAFILVSVLHALANGFVNPMIQTILSKDSDAASQGSIMGINASVVGLAMIFGPIVGGLLATLFIPLPFLAGSAVVVFCVLLSLQILRKSPRKVHI